MKKFVCCVSKFCCHFLLLFAMTNEFYENLYFSYHHLHSDIYSMYSNLFSTFFFSLNTYHYFRLQFTWALFCWLGLMCECNFLFFSMVFMMQTRKIINCKCHKFEWRYSHHNIFVIKFITHLNDTYHA